MRETRSRWSSSIGRSNFTPICHRLFHLFPAGSGREISPPLERNSADRSRVGYSCIVCGISFFFFFLNALRYHHIHIISSFPLSPSLDGTFTRYSAAADLPLATRLPAGPSRSPTEIYGIFYILSVFLQRRSHPARACPRVK